MFSKQGGFGVSLTMTAAFLSAVLITAYSSFTRGQYEERKAQIEKMFIDAQHIVWALGKYYEGNCITGNVSLSELTGSYIDQSYSEPVYSDYELSLDASGANVIGTVSFSVSPSELEIARKTLLHGATLSDGVLSYSKIVSSTRNSRDAMINNVAGITSPGGC